MRRVVIGVAVGLLAACATQSARKATAPVDAAQAPAITSHGAAGWVGQEFAGRTTANGEIFDPMLMTASHRTLPFGTLVDVRNPKTGQAVRVRINDRGPFVGDRLIDLSFAAAQQIGIADSGGGEVDLSVARVGRGDREPPAAFAVTVPDNPNVSATPSGDTTPASSPAPARVAPAPSSVAEVPATVENVVVTEQHTGGVETRRQVAANGTSIVDVPVLPNGATGTPVPVPTTSSPTSRSTANAAATESHKGSSATPRISTTTNSAAPSAGRFIVQVGAFSQEANAKALQQKLKSIGQDAVVDHTSLYHVHLGPYETRDQAVSVRAKLEAAGISAILVRQ